MLGLGQQVGGHHLGGRAVSSAITATSDGPASTSMPTLPYSWRFASATKALPAPDDHVGRLAVEQAEGHRGQRLHAAERRAPLRAPDTRAA